MLSQWPNIIPADFKEFHRYKKYLYKHGGEVGDIIPIPDSNNSLEDSDLPQLNEVVKNTDTDLPPLKEVIKDAESFLPKLLGALAEMTRPFGVSALMALAQVLITKGRVSGKYSTEQVYRMLCRYFEETESDRPRIKTPTGFTYIYSDRLATFDDLLQGL